MFIKKFLNKFLITAHANRTISEDPLQSFLFRIQISGIPSEIGFTKISGITREVAVVEYLENMYEHAHKLPGREKVSELTCEKGVYAENALQSAYESVFNNDNCRSTVTLQIMDRFQNVRREFVLGECWFSKYEFTELDAGKDDVIIEKLTMQFEHFIDTK